MNWKLGGALAALLVSVALAGAGPAAAACPQDDPDCDPGGGLPTTVAHTLTLSVGGVGQATSSPAGISCPADCTQTYSYPSDGTAPTITLAASGGRPGFQPVWGGACVGNGTCQVTMDADRTVSLTWADIESPTVHVTQPSAGATVGRSLSVAAIASDNDAVTKVEFRVDTTLKATDPSPPYTATIDLSSYAEGAHTVRARAYDASGRFTEQPAAITLDKSVSLSAATLGSLLNAAPSLAFTTDADVSASGRRCAAHLSGQPATFATCGSPFTGTLDEDGTWVYEIQVTDAVGNTASTSRTFTLDRAAPALAFTDGPAEGAVIGDSSATIGFATSDAHPGTVECAVDGGPAGACTTDHSHTLSGLDGGLHVLTVRAVDGAGNASSITRTFKVQPPATGTPGSGTGGTDGSGSLGSGTTGPGPAGGETTTVAPPRLAAKVSLRTRRHGARRVVTRLRLTRLPKGTTVNVSCKGRGCPFRSRRARARRSSIDLAKLLRHRALRPGVVLTLRLTAHGHEAQVLRIAFRQRKAPRLTRS